MVAGKGYVPVRHDPVTAFMQLGGRCAKGDGPNGTLTAEQEQHYARQLAKHGIGHPIGKRASDRLWTANLRLVVWVANKYQGRGVDLCDLISFGLEGLGKAVEKFDPDRANKFSTYAIWWIRQSILRTIANERDPIRKPVHLHDRLSERS